MGREESFDEETNLARCVVVGCCAFLSVWWFSSVGRVLLVVVRERLFKCCTFCACSMQNQKTEALVCWQGGVVEC